MSAPDSARSVTERLDPETQAARRARLDPILRDAGQSHLLQWWEDLDERGRAHLLDDLDSIRWETLGPLVDRFVRRRPEQAVPDRIEPAPVHPLEPALGDESAHERARDRGEAVLRAGRVAAFTVAGGQGTRLGVSGPKGAVGVTPVRRASLFQVFAEQIVAARERWGAPIRWYVMTNRLNHVQTLEFLTEHDFFGLPREDVVAFPQRMLPAFDAREGTAGRALLDAKNALALAPDGHGGSLHALVESGSIDDMRERGITTVSYFHVDNPLVHAFDPLFIGLHERAGSEMSSKVVRKADDFEKVGNVCLVDGRMGVIEYSNLPEDLATARTAAGERLLDLGNLGIHLIDVDFVERVVSGGDGLPFSRADKKVAFVDDDGVRVEPDVPNAVKLETFIFDAPAPPRWRPRSPRRSSGPRRGSRPPASTCRGPPTARPTPRSRSPRPSPSRPRTCGIGPTRSPRSRAARASCWSERAPRPRRFPSDRLREAVRWARGR